MESIEEIEQQRHRNQRDGGQGIKFDAGHAAPR
jgi:hypothetical protein